MLLHHCAWFFDVLKYLADFGLPFWADFRFASCFRLTFTPIEVNFVLVKTNTWQHCSVSRLPPSSRKWRRASLLAPWPLNTGQGTVCLLMNKFKSFIIYWNDSIRFIDVICTVLGVHPFISFCPSQGGHDAIKTIFFWKMWTIKDIVEVAEVTWTTMYTLKCHVMCHTCSGIVVPKNKYSKVINWPKSVQLKSCTKNT